MEIGEGDFIIFFALKEHPPGGSTSVHRVGPGENRMGIGGSHKTETGEVLETSTKNWHLGTGNREVSGRRKVKNNYEVYKMPG